MHARKNLPFFIIGFGVLIRVLQYLYNRSIWGDEAVLVFNIIDRSYLDLLKPLDYNQGAPIGFLMAEKLAVQLFGNNEYALRLFPLLSGISSLLLFYVIAKLYLSAKAVNISLAFFATLSPLVYYSSEVKQYSSDLAVGLLCFLLAININNQKIELNRAIFLSLMGAIAVWFAYPAIFVLMGVSSSVILSSFLQKKELKLVNIIVICGGWLLSFALFYFFSLSELGGQGDLQESWQGKYAFPNSPFDLIWVLYNFVKFFYEPLGLGRFYYEAVQVVEWNWIDIVAIVLDLGAILAFIFGCLSLFKRNKQHLLILLSPILLTLFAAYIHKYPFADRLVLFLTPFSILFIAEGIDNLIANKQAKRKAIAGIIILVLSLDQPVIRSIELLGNRPYVKEEIKVVINYVKSHQMPGDILYIYHRGRFPFKYYAERYGYEPGDYIIGIEDLDKYDGFKVTDREMQRYKADIDKLRGHKRVWFLFSHAWIRKENKLIKGYLDSIGKEVDFFETTGAFVYLYDLSK